MLTPIAARLILSTVLLLPGVAQASSTIFDGIIIKIDGNVVVMRAMHTVYSSEAALEGSTTDRDGNYKTIRLPLDRFLTYYIDEVPVSADQMRAVLRPGLRMVTMENRSRWYFLYISLRNQDSQIGYLEALGKQSVTLMRPQIAADELAPTAGGKGNFDHVSYEGRPHWMTEVELADDAVVRRGGANIPWRQAKLTPDPTEDHQSPVPRDGETVAEAVNRTRQFAVRAHNSRHSILIQAARPEMRVELMPTGFGDWENLVNTKDVILDYPDKTLYGMRHQVLGVVTGPATRQKLQIHAPGSSREKQRSDADGFPVHRLAGHYPYAEKDPSSFVIPIYYKGLNTIVDGFYAKHMRGWSGHSALQPGRLVVCFQRRGRVTTDRIAFSSENPSAWGTITAIDGNTVSVQTPAIDGISDGRVQTVVIPDTATMHHLGQDSKPAKVLQVGNMIQVFDASPQTILVDAGL
jgi:hypothetical protein